MSTQKEAQQIAEKLRVLKCSLIQGHPDEWVLQIMFKPYFERYQIIEWILSKLEFNVPDVSTDQNLSQKKAESLLAALCSLGILKENDIKIIEGTAPEKEQLRLWKYLVNTLLRKCTISQSSRSGISDEYNKSCNYINSLVHNVNLKALFEKKVQLFPPQVLKDSQEIYGTMSKPPKTLNEIKSQSKAMMKTDGNTKINSICETISDFESSKLPCEDNDKLADIENYIDKGLKKFEENIHKEFAETFINLKPHLANIPEDEFVDAGPFFETAHLQLVSVTKLNKSVSLLKKTEKELELLNRNLQIFHLPTEPLSDSDLGDFISTLRDE